MHEITEMTGLPVSHPKSLCNVGASNNVYRIIVSDEPFSEAEKIKICPYLSQNGSTVTFSAILLDRLESMLAVST